MELYYEDARHLGYLSLQNKANGTETFDILIKDIVNEYKQDVKVKNIDSFYKVSSHDTYLDTYILVGIPSQTYNWILNEASKNPEENFICCSENKTCQYTWIVAGLPSNKIVNCDAYSSKSKSKTTFGTLPDVVLRLKSNVLGYGNSRIRILDSFGVDYILHFILKDFQIIKTTDISSDTYPIIEEAASNDLFKLFNDALSN